VFGGSCRLGGCCRSYFLVNHQSRLQLGKRTDAEIELHAQSYNELDTEWNGYVLTSVSFGPVGHARGI
jgi:hypothetical protein